MKTITTFLFLIVIQFLQAQELNNTHTIITVNYKSINNGKEVPDSDFLLKYSNQIVSLSEDDAKLRYYMDYRNNQNVKIISYEEKLFKAITPFDSLSEPKLDNEKEKILGFKCKHAVFSSFSNKIEVWYTEKTKAKGSPYRSFIPNKNCLVLKILINGNRALIATSIEKQKNQTSLNFPDKEASIISDSEFEELKIRSRYISLSVFDNEIINFDPSISLPEIIDSVCGQLYRFSKGSVILKKIKLPETNKKGASVYAKLTSWSNGDAYDRTGSVFIIPPSEKDVSMITALSKGLDKLPVYTDNKGQKYQGVRCKENYNPPVEIMRFFTSFGARHFNNKRVINNYLWEDAVVYNQEITSLIPNDTEELWVGIFIGNYDKGGHKASLELNFYPAFEEKEQSVKWILPLVNTVNIMEMSGQNYGKMFKNDTLIVNFEIPENIENIQLLYTTTGHGGWGNGDEFNPKLNQIFIDDKQIFKIVPWRSDCATYRLFNPASGNFGNGQSSSDFSRSNWCPATLTPPYLIPLNNIESGKHSMKIIIDQGDDEGGSFNHWSISGILVGDIISK